MVGVLRVFWSTYRLSEEDCGLCPPLATSLAFPDHLGTLRFCSEGQY